MKKRDVTVYRDTWVCRKCMYIKRKIQVYGKNVAMWGQIFRERIFQDEVKEKVTISKYESLYLPFRQKNFSPINICGFFFLHMMDCWGWLSS